MADYYALLSNFIEKESIPIPNAYMQAVSALFPMIGEFGSADVRKKAHLLVDSVMGFDSVLTVLTLASKKKPLLLVVEDIQWIDSMSLALLDQALHKIGPEKFVFAATCRQPCGKEVERFLRNVEEDELCSLLSLAAFTYEETMQFIELWCPRYRFAGQGPHLSRYARECVSAHTTHR